MTEVESKVVYQENPNTDKDERVLRGVIVNEDDNFVHLQRRDGRVRIAKRCILRIEEWKGEDDDGYW